MSNLNQNMEVNRRALVLGGGGSAGNAWEIGVIAGLLDGGLDATEADLIVGTSAGATVAAQITSASPKKLLDEILNAPPMTAPTGAGSGAPKAQVANQLERTGQIIASAKDPADMRRKMGAAAIELDAASDGSRSTQWRSITASRLASQHWPDQSLIITAVNARTGEPVEFDRNSGVDLVDAIAASTSSGLPYAIGENRYIDGGYRRNENADLAAGYERVLVLSPFGGRTRHPLEWGMQLAAQVEELQAAGSVVETIFPDEIAREAFGDNMMDLSARTPAAQAGYNHGKAIASQLTEFWR